MSHDRYFISRVATSVLEILPHEAKLYPFGYEDYLEKSGRKPGDAGNIVMSTKKANDPLLAATLDAVRTYGAAKSEESREPTKAQLSYQAGKELARLQKRLQKTEEELERAEEELQELKDELMDPALASDYVKLKELQDAIDAKDEQILTLMEEYEKTDEQLKSANQVIGEKE